MDYKRFQTRLSEWRILMSDCRRPRFRDSACVSGTAASAPPKVIAVDVDGVVHPITTEIVAGAIAQARAENASLVLVRLNTPGGLMDAMRETIEEMLASPVPVVTYVAPSGGRAASAGFFMLEAGEVAAMAPGTNTGAAHPVAMGGGEMDPVMAQKVENDAAAYMRSITGKRGAIANWRKPRCGKASPSRNAKRWSSIWWIWLRRMMTS